MTSKEAIEQALKHNDPQPIAELDLHELEKLRIAEEILEARFHAKKRASTIAVVSSAMVGYVALAGFFANAYQNYLNKIHLQEQSDREEKKWQQEFERGRRADAYKTFYDVSALVTDSVNPERRLIGYALMDEFVANSDYHPQAVAILQEALDRELRESANEPPVVGLSKEHEIAVSQIIQAMSASTSCREFALTAGSIGGIVKHARSADLIETRELFSLYTRRLVGRATLVCKDIKEFDSVREPIREALKRLPQVAGLDKNPAPLDTNFGIAKLLVDACVEEQQDLGGTECLEIRKKFQSYCHDAQKSKDEWKVEQRGCDAVAAWPEPPPSVIESAAVPAAQ